MNSRTERAAALFMEGFNCSQSVFAAYADLFGMDEKTALRISASFGGGIGRMREVCGAANG
ncbi:MAG: C_GCAxxG_C_C family protein, partial [Firmicutes bacterium]|nr:C_GCAxxG_C_C family protein [Bacillota bacterium]